MSMKEIIRFLDEKGEASEPEIIEEVDASEESVRSDIENLWKRWKQIEKVPEKRFDPAFYRLRNPRE